MSDLVGNPVDRFSQNEANLLPLPGMWPLALYSSHSLEVNQLSTVMINNTKIVKTALLIRPKIKNSLFGIADLLICFAATQN